MISNAAKVKIFTEGASGKPCPSKPTGPLSRKEGVFLTEMVLSELHEFVKTFAVDSKDACDIMIKAVGKDISDKTIYPENVDGKLLTMAEQADAFVDLEYYAKNAFAKKGINLDAVFALVHEANMDKRDPKTKEFIRRPSDGKVLKREGWQAPDISKEIQRQREEGSWK